MKLVKILILVLALLTLGFLFQNFFLGFNDFEGNIGMNEKISCNINKRCGPDYHCINGLCEQRCGGIYGECTNGFTCKNYRWHFPFVFYGKCYYQY